MGAYITGSGPCSEMIYSFNSFQRWLCNAITKSRALGEVNRLDKEAKD